MNEKFWDLSKAKQDSMISSAVKIFAINGFGHASTDEIVAEASISKGLLFHYFYSKAGLYAFLAEYCARFALVELNSELRRKEALPYFEFARILANAEASAMRQYPFITLFLERVRTDSSSPEPVKSSLELYDGRLRELFESCVLPDAMTRGDAAKIERFLHLSRLDTAAALLMSGAFAPERYVVAVAETISFFEKFYP